MRLLIGWRTWLVRRGLPAQIHQFGYGRLEFRKLVVNSQTITNAASGLGDLVEAVGAG